MSISRHTMNQALDWQREVDARLRAHIAITRVLLHSYLAEQAEYQALSGEELVYLYLAQDQKDLQKQREETSEFHERLEEIGVDWIWQRPQAAAGA